MNFDEFFRAVLAHYKGNEMKKKYFFKVFENVDIQILQIGYSKVTLHNGIGEIETNNDDHKVMITNFRGVEYEEKKAKIETKAETKSDKKKE